jgi:hypothetical protein
MLGHHVHSEQAADAVPADESNPDLRKQKQKLQRGHRAARQEQFGDLGLQ